MGILQSIKDRITGNAAQEEATQPQQASTQEPQQTPLPKESPKSNAEQAYEDFKANAERKYGKVKKFAKNVQSDVENISQESINRAAIKGGKIIAGSAIIAAKNLPKNLEKANANIKRDLDEGKAKVEAINIRNREKQLKMQPHIELKQQRRHEIKVAQARSGVIPIPIKTEPSKAQKIYGGVGNVGGFNLGGGSAPSRPTTKPTQRTQSVVRQPQGNPFGLTGFGVEAPRTKQRQAPAQPQRTGYHPSNDQTGYNALFGGKSPIRTEQRPALKSVKIVPAHKGVKIVPMTAPATKQVVRQTNTSGSQFGLPSMNLINPFSSRSTNLVTKKNEIPTTKRVKKFWEI